MIINFKWDSQFIYVLLIFIHGLIKIHEKPSFSISNVRKPSRLTAVSLLEDNMTLMANVLLRTKCFIALHSLWYVIQDVVNSFCSLFFIRLHFRSTLHLVFNYILILEPDQSLYVVELILLEENCNFSPSNIWKIKLTKQKERERECDSPNMFRII